MPESQSEVTASSTSQVVKPVEVAQPATSSPAPSATSEKVYSATTDNQFSSAEMEALINKAKETKVEEVKTEVVDGKKEEGVQEVKPEVPVETKTEVVSKDPKEEMREMISSVLEEKFKGLGVSEVPEAKADNQFFGFGTQEELDKAYQTDPAGTTKKVLQESVKEMISSAIKEQIEPFKAQIAPVTEKLQAEQINSHKLEAFEKVPELKDPNSLMSQDFKKFMSDKDNYDLINKWAAKGKNPLLEAAKMVRAERLSEYVASAKQQGIKEGEEKARGASRAVVEGGGKQVAEENMSVEKFDRMTSAEQEKFLISKGAIRR